VRRTLVLSVLTAVAVAPVASAAPAVGPEQGSAAQFRLTTKAGVYTVSLLASRPAAGGAPVLRVRLLSSTDQATRFAGELPASALVTQGTVTRLSSRLGSVPLTVVFHPEAPVVTVSFGNVDSGDDHAEGWAIAGNGGTAEVTLGGVRCSVTLMATGTATVVDTGSYGQPLSTPFGLPLKGARCGDLPRADLPPVP
jgi:hypothetical protein